MEGPMAYVAEDGLVGHQWEEVEREEGLWDLWGGGNLEREFIWNVNKEYR